MAIVLDGKTYTTVATVDGTPPSLYDAADVKLSGVGDSEAIFQAVNSGLLNVFYYSGLYHLQSELIIPHDNVEFRSDGTGHLRKELSGNMINARGRSRVRFNGLEMSDSLAIPANYLIDARASSYIDVINCLMHDFYVGAMAGTEWMGSVGGSEIHFDNNELYRGWYCGLAFGNGLTNCTMDYNYLHDFVLPAGVDPATAVMYMLATETIGEASTVLPFTDNCRINYNRCVNHPAHNAIDTHGIRNGMQCSGNQLTNIYGYGIYAHNVQKTATFSPCSNWSIQNNTGDNCGGLIQFTEDNGNGCVIEDAEVAFNTMRNYLWQGINFYTMTGAVGGIMRNIRVHDNDIRQKVGSYQWAVGIQFNAQSGAGVCDGLVMNRNYVDGAVQAGGTYNAESGIYVTGATAPSVTVNDVRNCSTLILVNGTYITPEPIPPLSVLTLSATAGGTTDPPPGSSSYQPNEAVTLTAIPDTDYDFVRWLEGTTVLGTSLSLTITMSASRSIQAVFAPTGTTPPPPPPSGGGSGMAVAGVVGGLVLLLLLGRGK